MRRRGGGRRRHCLRILGGVLGCLFGRHRRQVDRVVGDDARLIAGDHQHALPDRQRRVVLLGNRDQFPVALAHDVFPGIGIAGGMLHAGADEPAEQAAPERAKGRGRAAGADLRPDDATRGGTGDGPRRARCLHRHLPHAHDDPLLGLVGLLDSAGIVGVRRIVRRACRNDSHEQQRGNDRVDMSGQDGTSLAVAIYWIADPAADVMFVNSSLLSARYCRPPPGTCRKKSGRLWQASLPTLTRSVGKIDHTGQANLSAMPAPLLQIKNGSGRHATRVIISANASVPPDQPPIHGARQTDGRTDPPAQFPIRCRILCPRIRPALREPADG
ncbi:protein of unknown function [Rhodovastum atsumiense]|nr:protein of unknown function [Rhodovastum atsumiense]